MQRLDPKKIWVADIKPGAVKFQKEQFNVNGIVSLETPDDLVIDKYFDCIFVASLFSHLPEDYFRRLLEYLYGLLNSNGVIIFTVHDASLLRLPKQNHKNGFIFLKVNEEDGLLIENKLRITSIYGTSYVTEESVRKVIETISNNNQKYYRYKKLCGIGKISISCRETAMTTSLV